MDKIIMTIPDWVVILTGFWILFQVINNILNIYAFYLQKRLDYINQTTSSTICAECGFFRASDYSYCGRCGAKLE